MPLPWVSLSPAWQEDEFLEQGTFWVVRGEKRDCETSETLSILSHLTWECRLLLEVDGIHRKVVQAPSEQLDEFSLSGHTCVTQPSKTLQRVLICKVPLRSLCAGNL